MKIDVIAFVLWKTIWFYPHTAKTNGPKDRYGTNDSTLVSNLAGLYKGVEMHGGSIPFLAQ